MQGPCPHCHAVISILSRGWQEQRASTERHCPFCLRPVVQSFQGGRFILSVITPLAVALAATQLAGVSASLLLLLIGPAIMYALFSSIQFTAVKPR